MADTYAITPHCNIINTYFYKILINKIHKISYITMSMPLLYNIEKFNNTVTIQCSVSMYTEEFALYTFIQDNQVCYKACVT